MSRRRRHAWELPATAGLLLAVVLIALLAFRHASAPAMTPATSARPAATAFARSYVAYLDGAGTLPRAAPGVNSIAAAAGRIPPADRTGALRVRRLQVSEVQGAATARALLVARDRSHTLEATLTLVRSSNRWQVRSLVPPDLPTIYAPGPAKVHVPASAKSAAVRFATAYVEYREHATHRLPAGAPLIRRQIAAGLDPLAGKRPTGAITVRVLPEGAVADVAASAGKRLQFSFVIKRAGAGWIAWQFPQAASS